MSDTHSSPSRSPRQEQTMVSESVPLYAEARSSRHTAVSGNPAERRRREDIPREAALAMDRLRASHQARLSPGERIWRDERHVVSSEDQPTQFLQLLYAVRGRQPWTSTSTFET